jgi:flavin reductase (DIM6/NTAB) family NADH-FMN oxidoreductase RutF
VARRRKQAIPFADVRGHLEPGPIVLITSAHNGRTNIMTLGWHMMLGFEPSLVGTYIWEENRSFDIVKASGECVINVPTLDLADAVIGIGNTHRGRADKFKAFDLTPSPARKVAAPLVEECYANFECKLADGKQINRYSLFIWEVVATHVATAVKNPKTMHYRGRGQFMTAGATIDRSSEFKRDNL